jgi:polyisoprenoid-binding protein YceI
MYDYRIPATQAFYTIVLLISSVVYLEYYTPSISPPHCFEILEGSRLFLEGKSNVNSFSCECQTMEQIPPQQMNINHAGEKVIFSGAALEIQTQSLDCGHRIMNQDLYKSLQAAHYPYIRIELEEASIHHIDKKLSKESWAPVKVCALLTVAGIQRRVDLSVQARQINQKAYRFRSTHRIKMTDYCITPPTAMFGTIKVKNEIDINFDLLVASE